MRPVVILMVGLPYSGKSTVAKATGLPMVSPDAIRLVYGHRYYAPIEPFVSGAALLMAHALIGAGHGRIIIDACNNSRKRRAWWIENLGDEVDTAICWVAPDRTVCLQREACRLRARQAEDSHIRPVIDRMAAEFERPEVAWVIPAEVGSARLYVCSRMKWLVFERCLNMGLRWNKKACQDVPSATGGETCNP